MKCMLFSVCEIVGARSARESGRGTKGRIVSVKGRNYIDDVAHPARSETNENGERICLSKARTRNQRERLNKRRATRDSVIQKSSFYIASAATQIWLI